MLKIGQNILNLIMLPQNYGETYSSFLKKNNRKNIPII